MTTPTPVTAPVVQKSGRRSAIKFIVFTVVGWGLFNAAAITLTVLVGLHIPTEYALVLQGLCGAIAKGAYEVYRGEFVAIGVPEPDAPTLTPPPTGGVTQ